MTWGDSFIQCAFEKYGRIKQLQRKEYMNKRNKDGLGIRIDTALNRTKSSD